MNCRSCNSHFIKEVFSLGELFVSDFLKPKEQPRSGKYEMKMMLCTSCGFLQLEKSAPSETMWGKYWYRSGINKSMVKELKDVVDSATSSIQMNPGDTFLDIACFPAGNSVMTDKGNVDIKDIKIGDMVLSHDNKYHRVNKLFKNKYNGEIIKFKVNKLNVGITATSNHPFLSLEGWKQAGRLSTGDFIKSGSQIKKYEPEYLDLYEILKKCHPHEVEINKNGNISSHSNGLKNEIPRIININKELSEIIGYYIGEGDGSAGSGIRFSFHVREMDKVLKIQRYFRNVFSLKSEISTSGNSSSIRINSRMLSSIFRFLCGDGAKNKKIPFQIYKDKIIASFISAVWFTDGHLSMHKNRHGKSCKNYVFSSVSKNLILDLRNLLCCCGINSSVQNVSNNRGFSKADGTIFRLTVQRNESVALLEELLRGETIESFGYSEEFLEIAGVSKEKKEIYVYNLEVDESHTYLCNGIVVHNCNDGTLLSFVPKEFDRIGIDPSDDSFKKESSLHGTIVQDYFSAAAYRSVTNKKAKIITIIAMFYDLDDPNKFLQDINEVMDDEGLLILQLSYTPLMVKQLAFDNICHEHIGYHSLISMERLLHRNHLKIVDCVLNDVNGGSFRLYVRKEGSDDTKFRSSPYRDVAQFRINSLLEYEDLIGVTVPQFYYDFYNDITNLKAETVSFICKEKSKGKGIWAYGASTKGNTLLQWYGLDDSIIDFAVERSPYKIGLRTAGTNIPITTEEVMRKCKPDYLLILPWHFISDFKNRESEYLKNGGKFIVPCPKFEIITK